MTKFKIGDEVIQDNVQEHSNPYYNIVGVQIVREANGDCVGFDDGKGCIYAAARFDLAVEKYNAKVVQEDFKKPRGMRIIDGESAIKYRELINAFSDIAKQFGYLEVVLPNVWGLSTFQNKIGQDKLTQVYEFKDKAGRDLCLVPEATAIVREYYLEDKKPLKVFYTQKCYRYERPQAGRYREFTQFGLECMGVKPDVELIDIMHTMLVRAGVSYTVDDAVKRGLDYYLGDGFEAECECLGAQKQVAGGGAYDVGVGFAIGIDRILLARERAKK